MSYRNQYSGSPWQQGGPPFGVGGYNQNYGGYNDNYAMMNSGYSRNQGGYGGGMYGGNMRGYGSSNRHYMNDRMGGRSMPRGQLPRKRLPQRSPQSGPRSKRPTLESDKYRDRSSKARHHRGDSRGRHDHSEDEEDDTYNPEEPTDDFSDVECDTFEIFKCSEDEESENKQNGEDDAEKATEGPKKLFLCYSCKVRCNSKEGLTKHQSLQSHIDKIEEQLAIRREKRKDGTLDEKKEAEDRRKSNRKGGNWCTVCECAFSGNFLAHRRTKEHRKKRDKKYPKCRPCRLGFSSSEEYRDHYKSEDHKQRSAEFHYLKNLASGSDDDEAAIEPIKVPDEEVEEKIDETEEKTEIKEEENADGDEGDKTEEESDDKKEDKKEEKEKEAKKKREPKSIGQSFVISVQGYYCKLCHKFFKDVSIAKSKHCRSIMHNEAYKAAMEEAIKEEEERQKVAEEQDKLDKEASEEAERAADIAAIERAARDALKKEIAARKAGTTKEEDVEMEDMTEVKTDTEQDSDEKAQEAELEANPENGSKEEEMRVVDEVKDDEDKQPEEVEVKQEQDEEPAPQPEEEVEEKVSTSSPATRRGRGRGRGRKRR